MIDRYSNGQLPNDKIAFQTVVDKIIFQKQSNYTKSLVRVETSKGVFEAKLVVGSCLIVVSRRFLIKFKKKCYIDCYFLYRCSANWTQCVFPNTHLTARQK